MKKILFITLWIFSITAFANDSIMVEMPDENSQFITEEVIEEITKAEADSAYIRNEFASAIQMYETLLKENGESAEVYYNLGNSYYKADQIAKAILNYERALLLKPGDNDIRFNLEMAYAKTVDKVNITEQIFFVSWYKAIVNMMSADAWAKFAICVFILFLISLVFYIFGKQLILKKIGFGLGILFLILTILSNVFAFHQKDLLVNRTQAIIISPSVTVKSTPNERGIDLFILHEGHKVKIKDNSMREWKEIQLEDGNVGWVPTSILEVI